MGRAGSALGSAAELGRLALRALAGHGHRAACLVARGLHRAAAPRWARARAAGLRRARLTLTLTLNLTLTLALTLQVCVEPGCALLLDGRTRWRPADTCGAQAFVVFEYADVASDEMWSAGLVMAKQVATAAATGVVPLFGYGE